MAERATCKALRDHPAFQEIPRGLRGFAASGAAPLDRARGSRFNGAVLETGKGEW